MDAFVYENDTRYLLGVEFPEMRKKFDGEDKDYIASLVDIYLNLIDKIMENSANRETCQQWLKSTDFFHAPSSARYHSAFEGGLLYHSLLVTECLVKKVQSPIWCEVLENTSLQKLVFAALTHDLCKINFYKMEMRNKKIYSENGSKHDELGNFDWKTVPTYSVEETLPYGHGEKSVYVIERHFFRLDNELAWAIRAHMGPYIEQDRNDMLFGNIIEKCPLALALYEADQEAAFVYETRHVEPKTSLPCGVYPQNEVEIEPTEELDAESNISNETLPD